MGPADPALDEGRVERGQQFCGPHRAGLGGQFGLEHGPGSGASGGVAPTTERSEDAGPQVVGDLLALALPDDRELGGGEDGVDGGDRAPPATSPAPR